METVCNGTSRSSEENTGQPNDEDFYILKFPHKLWKIVNECKTGAIQWGIYGKTILIDYNLFQSQYLECEIPKFKTRNMTSFVRQLNMYGFKKMQTQVKSDTSRYRNIHEFFHNSFRYGRYDLLDSVKRRPTPVKNSRIYLNHSYSNQSRINMCRLTFARALQSSSEMQQYDEIVTGGQSVFKKQRHTFQVIPLENSLKHLTYGTGDRTLTVEVNSNYEYLIDMEPQSSEESDLSSDKIEVRESEEPNEIISEEHYEQNYELPLSNNFMEAPQAVETALLDITLNVDNSYVLSKNHALEVKKGFDGANYVIDLRVSSVEDDTTEIPNIQKTSVYPDDSEDTKSENLQVNIFIKLSKKMLRNN